MPTFEQERPRLKLEPNPQSTSNRVSIDGSAVLDQEASNVDLTRKRPSLLIEERPFSGRIIEIQSSEN